ncbi:uncharacterized protein LOC102376306 [Alligator sinensis]|uniref:Uncharacterized protein LOC102376306 n=1 Tax=Alligator sinensis TaxID=38654 RepID=A0A3Q0HDG4_ALLSI|nr:uncharacterized protein LOC102376306 [Alligator sinensis]XP_025070014.1 uncharacterized protein LOC102376306 [Alligator sinensis]
MSGGRRERSRMAEESSSGSSGSPSPGDTLPWNLAKHQRSKRNKASAGNGTVLDPAERAVIRIADERDRVQKKTFTKWVNKHLIKHWRAEVRGSLRARCRAVLRPLLPCMARSVLCPSPGPAVCGAGAQCLGSFGPEPVDGSKLFALLGGDPVGRGALCHVCVCVCAPVCRGECAHMGVSMCAHVHACMFVSLSVRACMNISMCTCR